MAINLQAELNKLQRKLWKAEARVKKLEWALITLDDAAIDIWQMSREGSESYNKVQTMLKQIREQEASDE